MKYIVIPINPMVKCPLSHPSLSSRGSLSLRQYCVESNISNVFSKSSDVGNSTEVKEGKATPKISVSSSNGIGSDVINLSPIDSLFSLRMVTSVCQSALLAGWIFSLSERELILLCPHLISTPVTMARPFMNPLHVYWCGHGERLTDIQKTGHHFYLIVDTLLIHYEGCSWALAWESVIFTLYAFPRKSIHLPLPQTSL